MSSLKNINYLSRACGGGLGEGGTVSFVGTRDIIPHIFKWWQPVKTTFFLFFNNLSVFSESEERPILWMRPISPHSFFHVYELGIKHATHGWKFSNTSTISVSFYREKNSHVKINITKIKLGNLFEI